MRFAVLGPIVVEGDSGPLDILRPRHRAVLTYLLLHANALVPTAQIVDAIWGADPPSTARTQIQVAVSSLRKALRPGGAGERLVTEYASYRLRAEPDELDVARFDRLVRQARGAAADDPAGTARRLREALALHRGLPLLGTAGAFVEPARADLADRILGAWEDLAEVELRLGRHEAVVEHLTRLVAANPLRERPVGLLMTALYRGGRAGEALEQYRRLDTALRHDLGLLPGPALRALQRGILAGEPLDATPPARSAASVRPATAREPAPEPREHPVPRELPAGIADFVGRTGALATLDGLLTAGRPSQRLAAVVGPGGVGKTSLVVHWAHRVAGHFPDGQLYLDLRGYADTPPVPVGRALGRLLHALGVAPQRVPTDEEEAAALYRSLLSRRRILVVLDNVRHGTPVDPLVPGGPGCLTVLTSRDRPTWLTERHSLRRVALEPLPTNEAVALLATALDGAEPESEELDALAAVARACGYLPLGLRVAAAYLADRPRADLPRLGARMAADGILHLTRRGDGAHPVLSSLDLSYQALSAPARRLFRLAGTVPVRDLTVPAAAALVGATEIRTEGTVDELCRAHLLAPLRRGRYALHDLLREYAARQAAGTDPADERLAAHQRLVAWYDRATTAAAAHLYPHLPRSTDAQPTAPPTDLPTDPRAEPDPADRRAATADAVAWLDDELDNLLDLTRRYDAHGTTPELLRLLDVLRMHLLARRDFPRCLEVSAEALTLAEASGDERAQAMHHLGLGLARDGLRQTEAGEAHLAESARLSQRAGYPAGTVAAATALGVSHLHAGQLDRAAARFREAVRAGRGPLAAAGSVALGDWALVEYYRGNLAAATRRYTGALEIARRLDSPALTATAQTGLGVTGALLGTDGAAALLAEAVRVHADVGNRYGLVSALAGLSRIRGDSGGHEEALRLGQRALSVAESTGDWQLSALGLAALGDAELAAGLAEAALARFEPAAKLFTGLPLHPNRCRVLLGLAGSYLGVGAGAQAHRTARDALDVATAAGYRVVAGDALVLLARAELARAPEVARRWLARAVRLYRATGDEWGLRRAAPLLAPAG